MGRGARDRVSFGFGDYFDALRTSFNTFNLNLLHRPSASVFCPSVHPHITKNNLLTVWNRFCIIPPNLIALFPVHNASNYAAQRERRARLYAHTHTLSFPIHHRPRCGTSHTLTRFMTPSSHTMSSLDWLVRRIHWTGHCNCAR